MYTQSVNRLFAGLVLLVVIGLAVIVGTACSSESVAVPESATEIPNLPSLPDSIAREVLANVENHLVYLEWKRLVPIGMATEPYPSQTHLGYRYYECWDSIVRRNGQWSVSASNSSTYNVSVSLDNTMMELSQLKWEFFPSTGAVSRRHNESYC